MDIQKLNFITGETVSRFTGIPAGKTGQWGKMNAQQVVEHLTTSFNVSAGKILFDLVTPVEHLPRYKDFLRSDKEFRENTKAPASVIGEEALPIQYVSMEEAMRVLKEAIEAFEEYFKDDKLKTSLHPVFGELNYEEWILLHYKHVTHHLKQFGLL